MNFFGLDFCGSSQKEYSRIRMVETFCSPAIQTYLWHLLISYLHFFPRYLSGVVSLEFCLHYFSNRRNNEYKQSFRNTKTLNQFLETIIAKSSLKISSLNIMDFFQAFFSLLSYLRSLRLKVTVLVQFKSPSQFNSSNTLAVLKYLYLYLYISTALSILLVDETTPYLC